MERKNNRHSVIRNGSDGYVVDLYENNKLVESRSIPGKSMSYAEDVSHNWDTGLIQILNG